MKADFGPPQIFAQIAPAQDLPRLRPPRPEIPPGFWEHYGSWVIIGGILLLALAGAAIWFLTRPKPPVVVPPDAQARRALEALRGQPENGAMLSRVSQVLRQYVAAVFGLPPGELTTAEFNRAVEAHPQAGAELATAVKEFLCQCDLRKFSSTPPTEPLDAVAQGLRLIEQTEARLARCAQSASQGAKEAEAGARRTGEGK